MTTPWSQNDQLFRRQLERGYTYQKLVAAELARAGLAVELPELQFRQNIAEASKWSQNDVDLRCEGLVIEVKSRADRVFTTPEAVPFPDIILDTVESFHAKLEKPAAYVNISQINKGMVCTVKIDPGRWLVKTLPDYTRGIRVKFYCCLKEDLCSMQDLVKYLRGVRDKRARGMVP